MSAGFNAWRMSTARRSSPFARAVRMNGPFSVSISAPLIRREMRATCGSASTTTGSTRCESAPPPQPPTGSQPSSRPNTSCRMGATRKFGSTSPRSTTAPIAQSAERSR